MSLALKDLFGGKPMLETEKHTYRPPSSTWAGPDRAGGCGWGQLSHVLPAIIVTPLEPISVYAHKVNSPTGVN